MTYAPVASDLDIFKLTTIHKTAERILSDAAVLAHFLGGQQHLFGYGASGLSFFDMVDSSFK